LGVDYDVIIIGAGMSGLAAGIRLAYFGKRVCILEKHYAFGGLNSYYTLAGREFDVGLHAVTNFVPPHRKGPLTKLLRQLRLTREDFDLHEQSYSEVRFPGRTLRFTNDVSVLIDEVAREFPAKTDRFRRLVERVKEYDDARLDVPYIGTRAILREALGDPVLIGMILCPLMFYGSAQERDMDFTQFVTLFKSIFLEGFARPREGVRTIIKTLVRTFRQHDGEIRMRCGVRSINHDDTRATGVTLDSGEVLTSDIVLSSAGYEETMLMARHGGTQARRHEGKERVQISKFKVQKQDGEPGQLSFVESIAVLDCPAARLGHDATIVFYNDRDEFTYARPEQPVDLRSGIICCPNNYEGHGNREEGIFRLTWLANYEPWMTWSEEHYAAAKAKCHEEFLTVGERFLPGFGQHVIFADMFTPRTIHYYTGHLNGAVYGSPHKRRDGRMHLDNLFICGTDQGYLGIIGAMLSGITMANMHVLGKE
jgi:phytoene dehydrogenase-like protein